VTQLTLARVDAAAFSVGFAPSEMPSAPGG